MPPEPPVKRTFIFIDGQNLFYAAKDAFGYTYPNYDPLLLAQWVVNQRNWQLAETHFYTGIPQARDSARWNYFWTAKLAVMGTRTVKTFSRHLKYRNQTVRLPSGGTTTVLVGQEKGIDVRLALDVVRYARENKYDVAVIFSQDQDLSEVATEVRSIAASQNRWIKIACAYPNSPTSRNARGINGADWIQIDRAAYDTCLDPNDYRPKPASITATAGTPQSATINAAFTTQLQATVQDGLNSPVSGVTVTFTAPAGGASGTFSGGVSTAMTDAQGIATAAIFTANGISGGPYSVTASVAGVATTANFSLTNLA